MNSIHSGSNPKIAVLGGGISGLAAAFWAARLLPDASVTLLEKQPRIGGLIGTRVARGRCLETGPLAFPASAPHTAELLKLARAEGICLKPIPGRGMGLWNGKRIIPFTRTVSGILSSRLLSPFCLLRMLAEPFLAKGNLPDETISAFFRRRTGGEFLEAVMEPLSASILAGDPAVLSMAANFPVLFGWEKRWGSLAKGLWRRFRNPGSLGGKALPGGGMLAGAAGNQAVIEAIGDALLALGVRIRTACGILGIRRAGLGLALRVDSGPAEEHYDAVISCLPAYALAEVWSDAPESVRQFLEAIPYAPVAVGNIAYRKRDFASGFRGEGCLVQRKSGAEILSVFIPSRMFPERCPENEELVRVLAGGERFRRVMNLSDQEMRAFMSGQAEKLWHPTGSVAEFECARHERALPQLLSGHLQALAEVKDLLRNEVPALILAGTAFSGAGIEKGIGEGKRAAESARALLSGRE